jgi:hypothetical protein
VDENITAVDLLDNIKTETTKVYNDTNESTLKNNITESKTCINCRYFVQERSLIDNTLYTLYMNIIHGL